jgi:hypothetical protein
VRFGPFGVPDAGVDDALFGFACLQWSLARGTNPILRGPLAGAIGLTCESVVKKTLGQDIANGAGDVFEFGKGDAPGQPVGTVDPVDDVFGDAIKEWAEIICLESG